VNGLATKREEYGSFMGFIFTVFRFVFISRSEHKFFVWRCTRAKHTGPGCAGAVMQMKEIAILVPLQQQLVDGRPTAKGNLPFQRPAPPSR
jgi:hypothetical protein